MGGWEFVGERGEQQIRNSKRKQRSKRKCSGARGRKRKFDIKVMWDVLVRDFWRLFASNFHKTWLLRVSWDGRSFFVRWKSFWFESFPTFRSLIAFKLISCRFDWHPIIDRALWGFLGKFSETASGLSSFCECWRLGIDRSLKYWVRLNIEKLQIDLKGFKVLSVRMMKTSGENLMNMKIGTSLKIWPTLQLSVFLTTLLNIKKLKLHVKNRTFRDLLLTT